ncbi:dihydropteroate synthase [Pedobacter faecalis]|uniref:dihydropteroate synthase n=1 Tax=Pedobacter faecalis TaxID=3041495 RepID=UPI00254E4F9A|nr:dihydropteroate synthase [Pedobacter sp. ELA7]
MAKDTFLNAKRTLNIRGRLVDLSTPAVMGILNLTPDSFYGESRVTTVEQALLRTEAFVNEGASFIDIGAYSSRPGAVDVHSDEEVSRLTPVVEAIVKRFPDVVISVDTFRSKVAREAVQAGAHLVNDISAGDLDEAMFATVADLKVPYIIMHMRGNPQTMQTLTDYKDLNLELIDYFSARIAKLKSLGVNDIMIDPGFGFAKTTDQNYELLNRLEDLHIFGLPLLVGVSRKGMIYKLLGGSAGEALNGTTVVNTIALLKGATILRVHDVKAASECIAIVKNMK